MTANERTPLTERLRTLIGEGSPLPWAVAPGELGVDSADGSTHLRADSRLIAEGISALPKLLAVVEAAQRFAVLYDAMWDSADDDNLLDTGAVDDANHASLALDAALADLEAQRD